MCLDSKETGYKQALHSEGLFFLVFELTKEFQSYLEEDRMKTTMPYGHYQPYPAIQLRDRRWPDRTLTKAPMWCSVCLRDGNQALIEPMGVDTKVRLFKHLVAIGFKEIEVGFPAASQTEFDFVRKLIDEDLIPGDVTIQVLTQARDQQIERTFEAVRGAKRVIVHLYNSTSPVQRRVVFGLDRDGVKSLAMQYARFIKVLATQYPETHWTFEYSPESFTATESDFALDVCNWVVHIWDPTPERKVIINLPATVELATPNTYADLIEWMSRNLKRRDSIILSLHTHNDRGTGIAATELGLLAGADRVEGTLFGNGERTGNVDIVTLALNMMQQGIDPELDFSDITETIRIVEECTKISVHERHPYAGELAFTAFSGSHQDAIKKGFAAQANANSGFWQVPYLHIDPADIGRAYQPIRINSQSGKGGVGYIMEQHFGFKLPRGLLIDFSSVIQREAEATGKELAPQQVWKLFEKTYLRQTMIEFIDHSELPANGGREIIATIRLGNARTIDDGIRKIKALGNGPVDAFVNALHPVCLSEMSVLEYHADSVTSGTDASAVAYISLKIPGKPPIWGVGTSTDITKASLIAVCSAASRAGLHAVD